jgi:uncharacterized protein (DUF433 family)
MVRRAMEIDRITLDLAVMGGKPCIRGLRITAGTVLNYGDSLLNTLSSGDSEFRGLSSGDSEFQ